MQTRKRISRIEKMRYGITVYDSLFLAQAKSLKAKLVTGDKRKGRVAKEIGVDANLIE